MPPPDQTRRTLLRSLPAGVGCCLAGCSALPVPGDGDTPRDANGPRSASVPDGTWPMQRYDALNSLYNPSVSVPTTPDVDWRVPVEQQARDPFPIVGPARLYAAGDGRLVTVETETRRVVETDVLLDPQVAWDDTLYYLVPRRTVGLEATNPETVVDGVGSGRRYEPDWRADGVLYARRRDAAVYATTVGEVVALDAATGDRRWTFDWDANVDARLEFNRGIDPGRLIVTDSTVFAWGTRAVVALDRADGAHRWTRYSDAETLLSSGDLPEDTRSDVRDLERGLAFEYVNAADGSVLVQLLSDGAGDEPSLLGSLDQATGDTEWFKRQSGDGAVVLGTTGEFLFDPVGAWRTADGTRLWEFSESNPPFPPFVRSAVGTDEKVVVAIGRDDTGEGAVVGVDRSDGSPSWRVDLDEPAVGCAAAHGRLYVTTEGGVLALS